MRKRMIESTLVALSLAAFPMLGHAELAVIVSPNSSVTALSADQIAALFIGAASKLPNGSSATLADQPDGSPLRQSFYTTLVGKTVSQAKGIWARVVFTSGIAPPKEFKSSADIIAFVAATPTAIGYVDKSEVTSAVKVVFSK